MFLKWADTVVGIIENNCVFFVKPNLNPVVAMYTKGESYWSADEYKAFLMDRIISPRRKDIEKILYQWGLLAFDPFDVGEKTRAMNPKDLFWISRSEEENLDDVMSSMFGSFFRCSQNSILSPSGDNIKRYGVFDGKYGIFKKRLSPMLFDVEAELACYNLANRLGVPCCPVLPVGKNEIFSCFQYDFTYEYIIHFRRLLSADRSKNEYRNLIEVRPLLRKSIEQLIIFDFITRQDDRHLSNFAVKITDGSESFYPLYDNGRSLFFDEPEDVIAKACDDISLYSTSFGPAGSYYDFVLEIAQKGTDIGNLLDLSIGKSEIKDILERSGFTGRRLSLCCDWITGTLDFLNILVDKNIGPSYNLQER